MRHQAVTPSSLPSLMMPCSLCAGRMAFHGHRPISKELVDSVYACGRCGAEVVRTTMRGTTGKASEAA